MIIDNYFLMLKSNSFIIIIIFIIYSDFIGIFNGKLMIAGIIIMTCLPIYT